MSTRAREHGIVRWFVCWYACVVVAILGCSTLDGRDRGYSEQTLSGVSRVGAGAFPHNAADLPPMAKTVPDPTLGTAEVPLAREREAASSSAGSSATTSAQLGLAGVERRYGLPFGDSSTQPKALATRYANLQPAACRAELRRRRIAAVSASGMALGIATPMRLVGPLRGVRFVTPGPKSVHGKLDCRLVLLLDELSELLSDQGVAVVYVDGFYRPQAHLPGKKSPSQHAFGLAIDVHGFGTKDGRSLVIERDFAGRIGTPVCGEGAAPEPESRESVDLRNIVCAIARSKAFHYLLTPNYDAAHANHLHGDIKRGGKEHVLR